MISIKDEIIGAYNAAIDQLNEDKAKLGDVTVTLVTFGEGRKIVAEKYRFQPLEKLVKLNHETYLPAAMTPFYDGLGTLLTILEKKDKEDGVDRAFLVNVFTDGFENASKKWGTRLNPAPIREKVKLLQGRGNWTITYAGANVNLDQVAQDTGMLRGNMQGFEASDYGVHILNNQHVNSMRSYSSSRGMGATASASFYNGQPEPAFDPQQTQMPPKDWKEILKGLKVTQTGHSTLRISKPDSDEDDDNSLA
jgi:hypothetical protein